ncbi:MAG: hypothetical protein U0573_08620 [Phycisphaerales bacterium]|nr:hypothetical protein [Planctomycetota bacterium]
MTLVFAMAGAASALGAPPVIYDLGTFFHGSESHATGVSRDGNWVTGYGNVVAAQTYHFAFRWSLSTGLVNLGTTTPGVNTVGSAISPNGTWIAGAVGSNFGRWSLSTGIQDKGLPVGNYQYGAASDISDDGTVMVGTCREQITANLRGYFWSSTGGFTILPYLGYDFNIGPNTIANGVSYDGQVIVGESTTTLEAHACTWTLPWYIMQDLGTLPGSMWSEAKAISTDKQVIVGHSFVVNKHRLFRYANSTMVDLGLASGGGAVAAAATNYDGKVIVGTGSPGHALYWSTNAGMNNLNSLMVQLGANMTGWQLLEATGVSDDGTTIVGTGVFNGNTRAFVIKGMPCPSVPIISFPPTARSICSAPGASATLSMGVDAPGDLSNLWSVESPPGSGVYEPITGPLFADASGQRFHASGWDGPDLTISDFVPAAGRKSVTILPSVANPCGQTFAPPVQVVRCSADLDCNEQVDDADFVIFVEAYNELFCPTSGDGSIAGCPSDLNNDAQVDDADFVVFVEAYNAMLCV